MQWERCRDSVVRGRAQMGGGPGIWRSHGKNFLAWFQRYSQKMHQYPSHTYDIHHTLAGPTPATSETNGRYNCHLNSACSNCRSEVPKDEQFLGAALGQWLTKLVSENSRSLPQVRQPRTWASSQASLRN